MFLGGEATPNDVHRIRCNSIIENRSFDRAREFLFDIESSVTFLRVHAVISDRGRERSRASCVYVCERGESRRRG